VGDLTGCRVFGSRIPVCGIQTPVSGRMTTFRLADPGIQLSEPEFVPIFFGSDVMPDGIGGRIFDSSGHVQPRGMELIPVSV